MLRCPCASVVACACPHEGLLANRCPQASHAVTFPGVKCPYHFGSSLCSTTLLSLGASLELLRRVLHLSPLHFTSMVQSFSLFSPVLLNCQRPTASTADKGARDKKKPETRARKPLLPFAWAGRPLLSFVGLLCLALLLTASSWTLIEQSTFFCCRCHWLPQ